MTRWGGKAAFLSASFALAGCTTASHDLKVRSVGDPIAALPRGDELAVARGQLALNNVGLALEAFRKAQRERPSDPAAFVGIADCYAVMGRYDLAQANVEAALALSPRDAALLLRLARVLDLEGQPDRAATARRDAAGVTAAPAMGAAAAPAPPRVAVASITVALPPARPAQPTHDPEVAVVAAPQPVPGPSVTVVLPPARIADRVATAEVPMAQLPPPPPPLPRDQAPIKDVLPAASPAPRLVRISQGEVALVTTGQPAWRPQIAPTQVASAVRWVPLAPMGSRPNVQVLNAARSEGLAASAKAILSERGWRRIAIGDAAAVRQSSVVLYPKGRGKLARSLAAQFGIRARRVSGDSLVVVIGVDKAPTIRTQRQG